ncbi:unnamed protein product [Oppiella nova]|uniref:Uncharacterized protein n=1 Tax=Oppiella nova TaxID=334625 RepID=A0A7R9LM51_9ACAR|nr:unnamed protein product [Oppiella nova]CAG2164376.1 unnamed protein product [Oppiella nova]
MRYIMSEQSVRFSKDNSQIMTEVSNNEAPLKSGGTLDANVQLKYCLQMGKKNQFYYLMVTLISTSIILQIALGAAIILKSRFNINKDHHHSNSIRCGNNIEVQIQH